MGGRSDDVSKREAHLRACARRFVGWGDKESDKLKLKSRIVGEPVILLITGGRVAEFGLLLLIAVSA